MTQEQCQAIIALCSQAGTSCLSLPKYSAIIQRAHNAWKGCEKMTFVSKIDRPNMFTQQDGTSQSEAQSEAPASSFIYTVTKLLYHSDFRSWLKNCNRKDLKEYIHAATKRANSAAQKINDNKIAQWRADGRINLKDNDGISDFLNQVRAEMATESNQQNDYYQANQKTSRENSHAIEQLNRDIIALAFNDYLKKLKDEKLLNFCTNEQEREHQQGAYIDELTDSNFDNVQIPAWQASLYLLLHLIPAHEVNKLYQQCLKWQSSMDQTAQSNNIQALHQCLKLYLDTHDSLHTSQSSTIDTSNMTLFYEEDFLNKLEDDSHTHNEKSLSLEIIQSQRNVREISRFSQRQAINNIFNPYKVTLEQCENFLKINRKEIEDNHRRLSVLHNDWVNKKLNEEEKEEYKETLKKIIAYREQHHQLFLHNHFKAYRILMQVLARGVDYAGLWERDCYFIILAWCAVNNKKPKCLFNKDERKCLKRGQIAKLIFCLYEKYNKDNSNDDLKHLLNTLERHFWPSQKTDSSKKDTPCKRFNAMKKIRNDFAHFNRLREKQSTENQANVVGFSLTHEINQLRKLMSYDRKLKNSITASIKTIFNREGFEVEWAWNNHTRQLELKDLSAKKIYHLRDKSITESLNSERAVNLVKNLL